jgi:phospholipid/cholesterol/gamma-HCH transport system permease protein
MNNLLYHFGNYFILMTKVFAKPEKKRIYYHQFLQELNNIGVSSLGIVLIISLFMGSVVTLQTAYNTESPFLPKYLIGLGCRDSMILEFSSTMIALIMAGKVGSNIASELGTMRITEQIDALEIMGINSASFLILPKIIASLFFFPLLTLISIITGIFGGWLSVVFTGVIPVPDFNYGLQYAFNPFFVTYTLIKSLFFAYIISSVSSYYGYTVEGGALEVGRASTKAVVYSSINVLLFNVILTQLLLS